MEDRIQGGDFKLVVFRELSRIGKALADPKRLELLDLLCQSEKSVDHVARQLGSSVATVSHHLQILKASHLATERRSGRFIHYQASEMGKAVWKCLADIGAISIAEVSSAISQFYERDRTYEPLDLKELRRKVEAGEILLLDVRPAEEFQACHFRGAVSMPLRELEEKIRTIPRRTEVVAYCRGPYCVLAHEAVERLRKRGIRAYHWRQGVLDWRRIETTALRARSSRGRKPAKGASS